MWAEVERMWWWNEGSGGPWWVKWQPKLWGSRSRRQPVPRAVLDLAFRFQLTSMFIPSVNPLLLEVLCVSVFYPKEYPFKLKTCQWFPVTVFPPPAPKTARAEPYSDSGSSQTWICKGILWGPAPLQTQQVWAWLRFCISVLFSADATPAGIRSRKARE